MRPRSCIKAAGSFPFKGGHAAAGFLKAPACYHASVRFVAALGLRRGARKRQVAMDGLFMWFAERITASGGVVPAFIDYFAVIVGVITGAMFACDRKLDIVGTIVCGLFTAYGGGILRDFLLQDEGVYFMMHPYLFLGCVGLCFFVFYFRGLFLHMPSLIFLCDTLSVSLYAVAGASKAYACGSGFIMSVVLGAVVGVGGGAIRDSFVGEIPGIFKSSNYYAVAAMGGSFSYVLLVAFGSDPAAGALTCVIVTLLMRYLSVFFDWRTGDDPIDLTPYVSRPFERAAYIVRGLFVGGGKEERKRRSHGFRVRSIRAGSDVSQGDGYADDETPGLDTGGKGRDEVPAAEAPSSNTR